MPIRITAVTFDCADPYLLAGFWSKVTGFGEDPDNPNYPEDPEGLLVAPDGSMMMRFEKVPEGRQVKNRVHLDMAPFSPDPASRDAEIQRIVDLGARIVEDHRRPDGKGWAVLADPEGNELCIERGVAGD